MIRPRSKPRPGRLKGNPLKALRQDCLDRDEGRCVVCHKLVEPSLPPEHDDSYHMAHRKGKRMFGNGARFTTRDCGIEGVKQAGISGPRNNGKGDKWFQDGAAAHGSRSNSRKAASAMIAKIPFPLAQHIARAYYPKGISMRDKYIYSCPTCGGKSASRWALW